MLDQRQQSANLQATVNRVLVEQALRSGSAGLDDLLDGLAGDPGGTGSAAVARRMAGRGRRADPGALPDDLLIRAAQGERGWRQLDVGGVPVLVVVLPSTDPAAVFVELFPLVELNRIYRFLTIVPISAAVASGLVGVVVGFWASRRALRRLTELTDSAAMVAGGDLPVRLPDQSDPDLSGLALSFNATVAALERRVRRDERFAGDVSQELRSPLTTMVMRLSSSTSPRRPTSDLDRGVGSVDRRIQRSQQLVVDLLEIFEASHGCQRTRPRAYRSGGPGREPSHDPTQTIFASS